MIIDKGSSLPDFTDSDDVYNEIKENNIIPVRFVPMVTPEKTFQDSSQFHNIEK